VVFGVDDGGVVFCVDAVDDVGIFNDLLFGAGCANGRSHCTLLEAGFP
jgi:hypothetical protein